MDICVFQVACKQSEQLFPNLTAIPYTLSDVPVLP